MARKTTAHKGTPTFTRLHAQGYEPLPADGKGVYVPGWTALDVAPRVAEWDRGEWGTRRLDDGSDGPMSNGNIGLRCGTLRGFDIDILDADLAQAVEDAIRREFKLNGTPTRTGLAPKRLLPLRASQPGPKRKVTLHKPGLAKPYGVEVLGTGQQFIGFGIHPDTGQPYQWDAPLPALDHLPEVTDADIERMLAIAVELAEAHGYSTTAPEKPAGKRTAGEAPKPPPTGEPLAQRLLYAVECLARLPNETDGAVPWDDWKKIGGILHHFLSDAPDDAKEMFEWFSRRHPRYNERATRKAWKDSRTFKEVTFGTLLKMTRDALGNPDWHPADAAQQSAASTAPRLPEAQPAADVVKFPTPTGALATMQELILANSRRPAPDAALLAALVAASACLGNKYRLPDNTRLNLYALLVGTTGSGKDAPLSMSAQIVFAVNMALGGTVIGVQTGRMATGEGLEDALLANNGEVFWQHDESAHSNAGGKSRIDPNRVGLDGVVLKLWSASMARYQTRGRANRNGKKQGGEVIGNPYLNMLEATTPSAIEQFMSPSMIAQGRFGRMLFTMLDGDTPLRRLHGWEEVPDTLVQRLATLRRSAGDQVVTISVPADVDALLEQTMLELDAVARGSRTETGMVMRLRSFEKVQRVAGLLAVLESNGKPVLKVEHVRWARQLVEASDDVALGEVTTRLSDDELEAQRMKVETTMERMLDGKLKVRNRMQETFRDAGYLVRSAVLYHSKLDAKAFDMAIKTLLDSDRISAGKASTRGYENVEQFGDPMLYWFHEEDEASEQVV